MAFKLAEAFVQFSSRGVSGVIGSAGKAANALHIFNGAAQGAQRILNVLRVPIELAAQAEQTAIAFEVLTGSVEDTNQLIGDLKDLAAQTPFDQIGINDAARKLLAFNTSAAEVPETLRRIGDISAGIQAPIGEIAELYGKARVQGRLFGEDINQLTGRGIPIIQELAKQFGVAEMEVKKLVEQGRVTFTNLEEAFRSLTAEGGKFGGMMARQSQSAAGLWSTLKDTVTQSMTEIGTAMIEGLDIKSLEQDLIAFAETFQRDVVPSLVEGIQFVGDMLEGLDETIRAIQIIGIVLATNKTGGDAAEMLAAADAARADTAKFRADMAEADAAIEAGREAFRPENQPTAPQANPFTDADREQARDAFRGRGQFLLADDLADLEAVAAGAGQPLAEIAEIYATIRERGTATTAELNALAARGVPIWDALAERAGGTAAEIQRLAEARGGVDAFQFDFALRDMTAADGVFGGVQAGFEASAKMAEEQRRLDQQAQKKQVEERIAAEKQAAEQRRKQREDEARRIVEQTRTPAERLAAELSRLQDLKGEGLLDPETFARALRQAGEDFEPEAPDAGRTARFSFDQLANQAQDAALDFAAQQLSVEQQQLAVQQQILAAQQANGAGPPGPAVAEKPEPAAPAEPPPPPPADNAVSRIVAARRAEQERSAAEFSERLQSTLAARQAEREKSAGGFAERLEGVMARREAERERGAAATSERLREIEARKAAESAERQHRLLDEQLAQGIEGTATERLERQLDEQARMAEQSLAAQQQIRDELRDGIKLKSSVPTVLQ